MNFLVMKFKKKKKNNPLPGGETDIFVIFVSSAGLFKMESKYHTNDINTSEFRGPT